MPNDKSIGFGVVGLGMGAGRSRMIAETDGAELVAIADLDESRWKRITDEFEVDCYHQLGGLLERDDIDVVMIMTPSGLHSDMAIEAARAGKNVITTKPIDISLEKADRMIAECAAAGVKLAVDFESRYRDANLKIFDAIANGEFGRLILGEARLKWYRSDDYYKGWHGTWKLDGGGALINQTVHQIDLLQWFMGAPEKVWGQIGTMNHQIEAEDLGMAMLTFKNGAMGAILATTTYPYDSPPRMEIHGDKGGVVTEGDQITYWKVEGEGEEDNGERPLPKRPQNTIEDMVEAIREDRPPRIDGHEGKKSLEIIKAIYRSAESGKTVELPFQG